MTFELKILFLTALWTLLLLIPMTLARVMTPQGVQWATGNREHQSKLPQWHTRASKAHANMVENLVPFAIIVIVAHLSNVSNIWTSSGVLAFLILRVLHALCYWYGITPWRTYIFILSLLAELVIAHQVWVAF